MNLNLIISFFKPKENKFFPMIVAIGDNLVEATGLFKQLVETEDVEQAAALRVKIKNHEIKGDDYLNQIQYELNNTFITPFDREDIHTLCEHLDNILDSITSLSKRIVLYRPTTMKPHLEASSDIINQSCAALLIILQNLKSLQNNPQAILDACSQIHSLEQQGDDLYDATTARIFSEERDAVEIIKDKGIMSYVETTIDETYTVSKLVKTFIVKYA